MDNKWFKEGVMKKEKFQIMLMRMSSQFERKKQTNLTGSQYLERYGIRSCISRYYYCSRWNKSFRLEINVYLMQNSPIPESKRRQWEGVCDV